MRVRRRRLFFWVNEHVQVCPCGVCSLLARVVFLNVSHDLIALPRRRNCLSMVHDVHPSVRDEIGRVFRGRQRRSEHRLFEVTGTRYGHRERNRQSVGASPRPTSPCSSADFVLVGRGVHRVHKGGQRGVFEIRDEIREPGTAKGGPN